MRNQIRIKWEEPHKRSLRLALIITTATLTIVAVLVAKGMGASWSAVPDAAGYRLYHGPNLDALTNGVIDTGTNRAWYFGVAAVNSNGLESSILLPSNTVAFKVLLEASPQPDGEWQTVQAVNLRCVPSGGQKFYRVRLQ